MDILTIIRSAFLCGALVLLSAALFLFLRKHGGMPPGASALCVPIGCASSILLIGTPLYFLIGFRWEVIAAFCTVCAIGILKLLPKNSAQEELQTHTSSPLTRNEKALIVAYCVLTIASIIILIFHRTSDAILGPWDRIGGAYFILESLRALALVGILFRAASHAYAPLVLFSIHIFTLLLIPLLRFPLGWGFDPIIHEATARVIAEQGSIEPKNPYYIGYYILVIFLGQLFSLDVSLLNQLTGALLVSTTLPALALLGFRNIFHLPPAAVCGTFFFVFLTVTQFVTPTPWALAFLFSAAGLLTSIHFFTTARKRFWGGITIALFTASVCVHPLAGIPFFGWFCACLLFSKNGSVFKKLLGVGIGILSSISIPLAFILQSSFSNVLAIRIQPKSDVFLGYFFEKIFSLESRFQIILNAIYLFALNNVFLIFLCAGIGSALFIRFERFQKNSRLLIFAFAGGAAILLSNYVLTSSFLEFSSLVTTERSEYAKRLFSLALLFFLPFLAYALWRLTSRLFARTTPLFLRLCGFLFYALFASGSLYLAYPRNDAFVSFHGYSLSSADIASVHVIANDAGTEPHIVLANQVVGSAAVKEFGFQGYHTLPSGEKIFSYPIPTSSPLYPFFQTMLTTPERKTIEDAMSLVGAKHGYFVVPSYEQRLGFTISEAKKNADWWTAIEGGKSYVFGYRKK